MHTFNLDSDDDFLRALRPSIGEASLSHWYSIKKKKRRKRAHTAHCYNQLFLLRLECCKKTTCALLDYTALVHFLLMYIVLYVRVAILKMFCNRSPPIRCALLLLLLLFAKQTTKKHVDSLTLFLLCASSRSML